MVNVSDLKSSNEQVLKRLFTWLAKINAGPSFGSRPIGWYQQHHIAALDILHEYAKKVSASEVRVKDGYFEFKTRYKWEESSLSVRELYNLADAETRNPLKKSGTLYQPSEEQVLRRDKKNPYCDNDLCIDPNGEVRRLPIGGESNMILCNRCFIHEKRFRAEKGWFTPNWKDLEVYKSE